MEICKTDVGIEEQLKVQKVNKSRLAQAVGVAVLATISVSTMAQTELPTATVGSDDEESYKVDNPSSPKYTQPLVDTPSTISIIPETVLKDQGVTSLSDALRNVAGVSTFGGGEGGGGNITTNDKVTIRGFDANDSIFIDGIRDVAGYSRDMFNYEQVEVSKGAGSSVAGKSAAGGAINLSSKHARLEDFGSVAGSYDGAETFRITADYNKQISDSVAARLNVLYTDGGDRFDNGVENYETTSLAGSMLFQVSEKTDITLDAFVMQQDNTPMMGLPYITEAAAEPGGVITWAEGPIPEEYWDNFYGVHGRDYEDIDTNMLTMIINHEISESFSLRSQTRWGSNEKESLIGRPRLTNAGPGGSYNAGDVEISWVQAIEEENELFITQLDGILTLGDENFMQDIVVGIEYSREEQDRSILTNNLTYSEETVNLFNPSQSITFSGSIDADPFVNTATGKNIALYVFDTLSFGEHWQASISGRYDDFELSGAQRVGGRRGVGGVDTTGLESSTSFFSWGAALSYKPTENGSIYVSFSNSNEPPGTTLAFSGNSDEQIEARGALDPQTADSYEIGTKWELFDQNLLLSAAYFNTAKTVLDTADDGSSFLGGEQESKGFEFSAMGALTEALSVTATLTTLDTEITQDTNPDTVGDGLTAAPDTSASIWMTYKAMDGKLTLGGGANYSSGDTFWRRNTAFYETGSIVVAQLMAAYQISDAMKVQLNIDNLFDETYATDFSARGHFNPNDPRIMKVTFNYNF